ARPARPRHRPGGAPRGGDQADDGGLAGQRPGGPQEQLARRQEEDRRDLLGRRRLRRGGRHLADAGQRRGGGDRVGPGEGGAAGALPPRGAARGGVEGHRGGAAADGLSAVAAHATQGDRGRPRAGQDRPAHAAGDAVPRAHRDRAGAGRGPDPARGGVHPARRARRLSPDLGGARGGAAAAGQAQPAPRRGAGRVEGRRSGVAARSRAGGAVKPLRWLVPVTLLAGGGWLGVRALRSGGAERDVPTFTVVEGPFTRTVSAEGVLKPVKTTVVSAPSEGREPLMIAWMAEDGDPVKQGEVVVRFDALEVTKKLADGQSDRAAAESRIEKEKTLSAGSLHERDRTAAVTREELENNRQLGKKDPRFFPRAEVIESEIDEGLFQKRLDHARDARQIEEKLGRSRVDLAAIDRRKAELYQKQASATLKQLEIRAPHDGTFTLQRWGFRGTLRAGDRAFAGMRIAEISTSEQMDAEVFVLEADAGGLSAGKKATVVIEAQPDVVWKAKVKRVDPFPKPRQPEVPAQYFATLLEI